MAGPRPKRILVVEDDASILLGLRMNLEREGYEVSTAIDGDHGLEQALAEDWDLIILDVMLPKRNGYEIVSALRAQQRLTKVLMLSARTSEVDKVMGLDLGADDYVTKPFSLGELLARVRAALRRRDPHAASGWRMGELEIDPTTREVRLGATTVSLTPTEFDVLAALARAGGRVLSRAQIMDAVWRPGHHGTLRTIDNFIAQLRAKLEEDPTNPRYLLTVRGAGYRLLAS